MIKKIKENLITNVYKKDYIENNFDFVLFGFELILAGVFWGNYYFPSVVAKIIILATVFLNSYFILLIYCLEGLLIEYNSPNKLTQQEVKSLSRQDKEERYIFYTLRVRLSTYKLSILIFLLGCIPYISINILNIVDLIKSLW